MKSTVLFACFLVAISAAASACGDDDPAANAPGDAGAADGSAADTGSSETVDATTPPPDAGVVVCEGVERAPDLHSSCASCTARSCCAEATACYVGSDTTDTTPCQKVFDCIVRCQAGTYPLDSGIADSGTSDSGAEDSGMEDAGDAATDDAAADDAGPSDAGDDAADASDANAADAGASDAGVLERCLAECVAPFPTGVAAAANLTSCQTSQCESDCR